MRSEYLRVFRAFTDENRVQILELLCQGEQCACVLLEQLNISQPTLSHHMKLLCQSGIVKSRRVGPWNYYSINEDGCDYASHLLKMVAQKNLPKTLEFAGTVHRFLRRFRRYGEEAIDSEVKGADVYGAGCGCGTERKNEQEGSNDCECICGCRS